MACTQTLSGITRDCLSNRGGVKSVLLFNAADIDLSTMVWEEDMDLGSVALDEFSLLSGKSAVSFEFRRGAASLNSTETVNSENGSQFVTNELTMTFHRMSTARRSAIVKLQSAELGAIVEDENGNKWYLGPTDKGDADEPLILSAGSALSGTSWEDPNGYTVTLSNRSKKMPWPYNNGDPSNP